MSSDVMLRLEKAAFCLFPRPASAQGGGGEGVTNCSGSLGTEELQDLIRRDGAGFPCLFKHNQNTLVCHCRSPAGGGPRGPF